MAQWSGNKVNPNDRNVGIEYRPIDKPTRQQLNAIVNNSLYASYISESIASQLSSLNPNEKIEFKGSNPNLLINSNFSINQRGISNLTGTNQGYMVDRWRKGGVNSDVSFNGNTCTILINSGSLGLVVGQTIELLNMGGKTITASMNILNSNITENYGTSLSITYYNENTYLNSSSLNLHNKTGLVSLTVTIPANTTRIRFSIQTTSNSLANETITFDSPKIEIGSVATAFSPRPYAEELSMCQRYYLKYETNQFIPALNVTTKDARVYLKTPIPMRVSPTFKATASTYSNVYYNGVQVPITNLTFYIISNDVIQLTASTDGLTFGYPAMVGTGNNFELDAEIY